MTEPNLDMTISPTAAAGAGGPVRGLIGRSEALRRVVKSGPVQSQIKTARALGVVDGRSRFLAGQLAGRGTRCYRLRGSGMRFNLRHGSGDVAILNKIFARDPARSSYAPPAAVASALDALAAPRILDVGANIGLFGVYALGRWPGADVTAFEPDPANFEVLSATIAANDAGERWRAVPAAVAAAAGELSFVPGQGAKAHLAGAGEGGTITVPSVDFYKHQGDGVDLVKMDIEGGEWEILADPRLATLKAGAIRLEWHTMMCPALDARAEAIRLLQAGGFTEVLDGDREHERNGVLWAWR